MNALQTINIGNKAVFPTLPKFIQLETTIKCNLRCVMCTQPFWSESLGEMPWEDFLKIVDHIGPTEEYKPRIELHGVGESLVHRNFFKMAAYLRQRELPVQFTSNFTLLDRKAAEQIFDLGFDSVRASIDGATKTTYESIRVGARFESVMDNLYQFAELRRSREHGPRFTVNCVISKTNVAEAPLMVDIAKAANADELQLIDVVTGHQEISVDLREEMGRSAIGEAIKKADEQHMRLSFKYFPCEQIRALGGRNCYAFESPKACHMPFDSAYVTYEGFVFPCPGGLTSFVRLDKNLTGMRNRMVSIGRSFGNLKEEPLSQIWKCEEYVKLRNKLLGDERAEICKTCAYLPKL